MPPRTQAALLEAMEERQITIDGSTHHLSSFFTVFATQNPIEFEGTYPLPEAQLDRFLLKIKVTYPEADQEITILEKHHAGFDVHNLQAAHLAALPAEELAEARAEVRNTRVEPALFRYIVEIVRRTRDWPALSLGASPRAAVSLMMVAKAVAALEDRDFLIPDDVKTAALPVLRHRVIIKPEAELEGLDSDRVLGEIVGSVEVPK
jgi:MoxR-like ATPase